MSQFQEVITIGFDKNGEADFRICMVIASFDYDQMNQLRRMIPLAIAEAENLWRDHGPPSKEMGKCDPVKSYYTPAPASE